MIALDVPIETAGKRGHRVAQAHQLSESARWSVVTTAWEVRRKLTGALLDYTVARNREGLLERQLDLQTQIVRLEEGELAAGAVAGSDVTVGRIQLAKTRLDLETTRAQVAETRARSADALGVPLRALDGAELIFGMDPTDASALTAEEARHRALRGRSDVLGSLAEYEAAQAALQLEIAKQYPDIRLGPGYQWDQGQNDWLIGLTVELPVFNRNQGPIAEAAARRTEAAARFVALQAQIIHEIDAATAALKTADEASLAGVSILAAQRQNLEAVEGQLKAGAVGALEVSSAQIEAVNAETLAFEASARRQQAVRSLEDAVQRPIGSEADAKAAVLQIESTQRSPR
jgi:outer membrane protein TolC